jgi:hypothetical protein
MRTPLPSHPATVQDAATAAAQRMRAVLDGPGDRQAILRRFTDDLAEPDIATLRALLVERSADEDAATVAGDRDLVARAIAKAALGGRAANGWTLAAGGSDVVRRVDALTRPVTGRPWTTVLLAAVIALGSTAATCAALADFIRVALAWLPLS